jgi:hypothetical protein
MRIGLSFLPQLQALPGGGWVTQTINDLVASILGGYHVEHNHDDTHSIIHATGAVYERARSVAMGAWIPIPYAASDFTASGTMTWTVAQADVFGLTYTLIGTTMILNVYVNTSTLGGGASTDLRFKIPGGHVAATNFLAAATRVSNNTNYCGNVLTLAETPYVIFRTFNDANWDVAAAVRITGQIAFPIK